jgi:AraC-like DNA-binding protein
MPSSAVSTFTDPDDYAAAISASTAEVTATARGRFGAKITVIRLHWLWMQRFSDNLPRILHSAIAPGRAVASFLTGPGADLDWSGAGLRPTNLIRHVESENAFQRSSGSTCFGSMSLPTAEMVSVGEATAGLDLTPPKDPIVLTPSPAALARLQRLHAAAGRLAKDAPEIISHPEAARGLEQALIGALVDCLAAPDDSEKSLAQGQHAIVMRRFRRVVEANTEYPLYIPEICNAIGVSSRTLQACCHEHLGMGPKRYLLLRRMHLAKGALRQAAPETASVTEIATRYGFWQLGRFAVEYQSLFGEAPSTTLARQPSALDGLQHLLYIPA